MKNCVKMSRLVTRMPNSGMQSGNEKLNSTVKRTEAIILIEDVGLDKKDH